MFEGGDGDYDDYDGEDVSEFGVEKLYFLGISSCHDWYGVGLEWLCSYWY